MKTNLISRGSQWFAAGTTRKALAFALAAGLTFAVSAQNANAFQDAQGPMPDQSQQTQGVQPGQTGDQSSGQSAAPAYTTQTPAQLQQLVAPIALYPDSLVAQVLAGSTFPAQIVEADRYLQDNPNLKGDALAQAVDQMQWDPSVKALTAFPTVLGNMDKNLSWTSSLGDAYYNQQQDVMDAVQAMRQKAQTAGNLKSTDQQTVQDQGSSIVIQPANPQVVYVPAYNPWGVYGYPVSPWPYWYNYPGIWYGGPSLYWGGIGFGIGWYGGYGWGWNNWGANWGGHYVVYNRGAYYSHSNTFYNRNNYYRNGGYRGVTNNVNRGFNGDHGENVGRNGAGEQHAQTLGHNGAGEQHATNNVYNHPGATARPFNGNTQEARGYGEAHTQTNTRSSAFSGYNQGGESRSYSSRGSQSFGGGGGSRGGGFGGGGGGSHGGGRGR
ncbi:MAG TPA: DUF3300 domain-containing protein [Candidatus Acidoferrales bacterium]